MYLDTGEIFLPPSPPDVSAVKDPFGLGDGSGGIVHRRILN